MRYSQFQSIGRFSLYAGKGQVPNNYASRIESHVLGGFTQLLILEANAENILGDEGEFFIVIEGEKGSKFELEIREFEKSSPKLKINETVFYYSR